MRKTLNANEFKLLVELEANAGEMPSQRELAAGCAISVGTVNRTVSALRSSGFVGAKGITDEGREALEPYRARRVVLIAAGFGSRMVPITLNTPKPLVRVHGVRIIDTLLDALVAADIREVYIVRGYLAEQFDQLKRKYPFVRFVENPLYNEANNISSLVAAKDLLEDAYVFESDLLLKNPALISKYQYSSNYLGVPVPVTDDWCFQVKNGRIVDLKIGGTDCHHMYGVSFWTAEDGRKLAEDLPSVFAEPGGKELFWDEVPLRRRADRYSVQVRDCTFDDICEIDTFRELQTIDPAYAV